MRSLEQLRRTPRWGCVLLFLVLAGGCMRPEARVLQPSCRRIQPGKALEALVFTATVETRRLVGEQLVYEVSLRNQAGKPLRSDDGRYQNKAGAVAASRTLIVLESPCTFKAITLSIPASELRIRKNDWPLSARFSLLNVAGQCLAEAACAVPPEPTARVATTRPAPAAAPRAASTPPPATGTLRKEGAPTTRPTTQPTRPRAVPPVQQPTPRARPKGPAEQVNPVDVTVPDVDPVAKLNAVVTAAEEWMSTAWLLPRESGRRAVTSQGQDSAPASAPVTEASPHAARGAPARADGPAAGTQPHSVPDAPPGPRALPPATRPSTTAPAKPTETANWTRYVVQRGDSLTRIAERILGDADRWQEIYAVNRDQLDSPDRLREGMALWIPPVDASGEDK